MGRDWPAGAAMVPFTTPTHVLRDDLVSAALISAMLAFVALLTTLLLRG
jgi:hypothetical protein